MNRAPKGKAQPWVPKPRARPVKPVQPEPKPIGVFAGLVVSKTYADGAVKAVHDSGRNLTIESFKALQGPRRCFRSGCELGSLIVQHGLYVELFDHNVTLVEDGEQFPHSADYHVECITAEHQNMLLMFLPEEEREKLMAELEAEPDEEEDDEFF